MGSTKHLAALLLAFGLIALFAFYKGAIQGDLKWEADKPLSPAKARLAGWISLVIALVLITAGSFVAYFAFLK